MTNTIAFPGLGLEFTINRIAFHIFSRPVYWYALIIMTGFCIALAFVCSTCKKRGVSSDAVFDIAFWGLIFGIIGARIYYVIFDPECLDGNIFNIVKIWEGGLAIYGGIIAAVLTAFVYCRKHKLPVYKTFDVFAPGLLIGQAVGRWGNFVNAEVFGKETNSLFRMSINSEPAVHPLFLYESVWNVVGLIIILLFRDKKKADGQVFFFYTLWYGTGRLFFEGMRRSDYILYLVDGKLGISQAVSAIAIIVSVVMIVHLGKKSKTAAATVVNDGQSGDPE